jgi:hypothetical protein
LCLEVASCRNHFRQRVSFSSTDRANLNCQSTALHLAEKSLFVADKENTRSLKRFTIESTSQDTLLSIIRA